MHYVINVDTGALLGAHGSAKAAKQATADLDEDTRAECYTVTAAEDLDQLTIGQLVALHNAVATVTVATFKGKSVATERAWAALEGAHNPKMAKQAAADAKAAAKAAKAELEAQEAEPDKPAKGKKAKAAVATGDAAERATRTNYAGKTIKVLTAAPVAREGTWTHFMINSVLSSATTDEAKAKVADSNFAHKMVDFSWLAKKGYVAFQ